MKIYPMTILLTMLAGWLNRQQSDIIDYLSEENKRLLEKLGSKRILLNDAKDAAFPFLAKSWAERPWISSVPHFSRILFFAGTEDYWQ